MGQLLLAWQQFGLARHCCRAFDGLGASHLFDRDGGAVQHWFLQTSL